MKYAENVVDMGHSAWYYIKAALTGYKSGPCPTL